MTTFILARPRSRTKWLSEFLSTGENKYYHECSTEFSCLEELNTYCKLYPNDGFIDTGLVMYWEYLQEIGQVILIDREEKEVVTSIKRLGLPDSSFFYKASKRLQEAIDSEKFITYRYEDLKDNNICNDIYYRCNNTINDKNMQGKFIVANIEEEMKKVNKENLLSLYGRFL